MPLSEKGTKIKKAMAQQYGAKKGEQVFYASANKGVITGVEKRNKGGLIKGLPKLTKILQKEDIMAWNYKTGGKEFKIPEQKKSVDPRSKTSIRGKNYIATGDKNPAKVAKARKQTVTWF